MMNTMLIEDLIYAGVAVVALGLEHFSILPSGGALLIIGLVTGTALGKAQTLIHTNMVKASE
jgi:hypothetical protein